MQLNPEQQKAVIQEKGQILVVAGAGTGKTRVITERIKWLINNKNVQAQEILALTFTEKSSQEMAERVEDALPLGYEEPYINTFHAFCDRLLKAEGLEIGIDPSYKILSGPQQWLLFRKNLFNFNLKYFRPLGNPTKFISAMLKFISRLQDENITTEELTKFAKNYDGEKEDKERWVELAHVYKKYQEIKIEKSKFDFGDLIIWAIKLLEQRPNILKKYQKQFKHVLLDEFQDTNYSQYQLVKLLCPKDLGERSLLAVGDDSQSIYKFRGAAVSNIIEFMEDFPEAELITLTRNYRSTQKILDPSYRLIQENNPDSLESTLKISKKLTSEIGGDEEAPQPQIIQTETIENEVEYVISKIYEILAKEPTYTYKDIAILSRANNHLDAFVLALKKHGLPYQLVGNRGLYDQEEIRDVLALLKVLINPKDSISLYRVLNIDIFEIPQEVITQLLSESKHKKQDIWELFDEINDEKLNKLQTLLKKYQNKITKSLPVEFVYSLINETNYLNTYLKKETIENNLSIKNLDLFLNIIKRFEVDYRNESKDIPTVVDLLDYLELIIEAGDNPAQAEIEDIDTINLLTIHSSKGLEFPAVFMVNLVAGRFPTRNRSDLIQMPDELVKETLPTGNEHIQEERRLFYVGMTRAQKYLYLMGAKNYGGKREKKPSGYLSETGLQLQTIQMESKENHTPRDFKAPVMHKTDFTPTFLSFSQIDSFKTCPLQYKYNYVLNVPTAPSHALSYGITIHDTLRDFHQKLLFNKVSLEEILKMYEDNWQPLGYLDEKHRETRFEEGKFLIEDYFDKHKDLKEKPIALERAFNIKIGGIKFYGKIDRIDKTENGVEIIDYKTGKTKTQKDIDKDDQVAFYAIAVRDAFNMNPEKLTYYFVESGTKLSTTRTEAQLNKKKEEVAAIVEEIKEAKFEPKSGMHCQWCSYKELCPFAYKG